MESKKQQQLSIFNINFSEAFANKVSKKRFEQILSKHDKVIIDQKWKMLCEFAGRKEKAETKVTPKKKESTKE